jgi:hypothetical protein
LQIWKLNHEEKRLLEGVVDRRSLLGTSWLHDVLIVENERCRHQLPLLPDTVASWELALILSGCFAAWPQDRRIAYWGDLDTWGLLMLSRARARPCL